MTLGTARPACDREALRARIFLRSVVPLLEVVLADQPAMARLFRGVSGAAQIEVGGSAVGACLVFTKGALTVEQGVREQAEVRCSFRDLGALNTFFAGKPALPRVKGLRHPLLLAKVTRLLLSLRLLQPQPPPAEPEERALRVKLLLYLVTRALGQLHHGGYAPMVELVEDSPERVYQWTVAAEGIGAYLRMHRGRIKAGQGTYPLRRPFVHFVFPDVRAALHVLTATGSQMSGVRGGLVQTLGSPEYTRKISLLMQKVDELLVEG